MQRQLLFTLCFCIALSPAALAQTDIDMIHSAMSAALPTIAAHATIMDWENNVLREGTNGWTCFPDMPHMDGENPMCLDEQWVRWLNAYVKQEAPDIDAFGLGYMLQGDAPQSNTDPYPEGPTADNEWMEKVEPHVMLLLPDPEMYEGMPVDPESGGAWVMWRDTPFVHVMIPAPRRQRDADAEKREIDY